MYKIIAVLSIVINTICYHKSLAEESLCGEWEAYKDEKCFKLFDDSLINYDDAIKSCVQQNNSATLAIIRSKDEQDYITNFVFGTKKIADNVWIGIRNISIKFTGIDNLEIIYTNWSPGSPQNDSDYNCVQMIADNSFVGKWINEPCVKKSAYLCEKMQVWSVARLQKTLLEDKRSLQEEIKVIKQNPVPIGFIYVQLPGQNEPKVIWPTVNWTDVSSTYAGLFFRVLGSTSEAFEAEQSENDKYLHSVKTTHTTADCGTADLPLNGDWSSYVFSGDSNYNPNNRNCQQYKLSVGEIRPRNKAVKIWKRTL